MKTLKPEEALTEWQSWGSQLNSAPELRSTIKGGLTNKSYLLSSELGDLVLRIHHPNSESLGINRFRESVILRFLDGKDICPKVVYQDTKQRYLVYQYVEGRSWTKADLEQQQNLDQLSQLINRYQQIQIPITPRDYKKYLEHYWSILQKRKATDRALRREWQYFLPRLEKEEFTNWTPVLSHHDLTPENIIETEYGLRIIDWEYAHMGHPNLDWVIVTNEQNGVASELLFWMNRLWHLLV